MPIQPDKKPNPSNLAHGNYEKPPEATVKELQARLAKYDRSPFTDVLATWLAHLPPGEALADLAMRDPYKWAKAMATLAPLAGFVMEKKEVHHRVSLEHMSDMELLQFVTAQRKAIPLQPIDAAAETVVAGNAGSGEVKAE